MTFAFSFFSLSHSHLQCVASMEGLFFCVYAQLLRVCECVWCATSKAKQDEKKSQNHEKVRWIVSCIACCKRIEHTLNKLQKRKRKWKQKIQTHKCSRRWSERKENHNRMKIRKMQPREINTIKKRTGREEESRRTREWKSRTNIKYITQCPPCLRHANSKLWLISDQLNWIMILFFIFFLLFSRCCKN